MRQATLRYYLRSGDYEALDALAASRASAVDNPGMRGSAVHYDRLVWAATARLLLEDTEAALALRLGAFALATVKNTESAVAAGFFEVLDSPSSADVVRMVVEEVDLVMIFDEELDI